MQAKTSPFRGSLRREREGRPVKRQFRFELIAVSLLAAAGCSEAERQPGQSAADQPNVVLILADDLGYGDVGGYGSDVAKTPNIDALAIDGVRFTDGYVSAAVCSPTRAGLITGRYQSRFGYEYNPTANYARGPDATLGLPLDQRTLGNLMQDAGYATGLVGKWHLGAMREYHPLNRGFDEFFGLLGGGTSYIDSGQPGAVSWPSAVSGDRSSPLDAREIMEGFEVVEVTEYLTDVFAERAVDFIDRHAGKPFFLMLAPNAPHTPIQATARYVERFQGIQGEGPRIFAAMVSALDDAVGQVVEALRIRGLEENTVVVFLSDNGCINYARDTICSNSPLSGAKRYHLEGGLRVPFIIKWPAGIPQGVTYTQPVISLDLFATFGAAAGASASELAASDGVNLIPHIRGDVQGPPHEFLFWRSAPNAAVRSGRWKLWKVDRTDVRPGSRTGALLPEVEYPRTSPNGQLTVLYDLSEDISEQANLADSHPEIVERLEGALGDWHSGLAEPMWSSRRSTVDRVDGQSVQLYF